MSTAFVKKFVFSEVFVFLYESFLMKSIDKIAYLLYNV